MHNLKTNFDKILDITKSFFLGTLNTDGSFYHCLNKLKMSDSELITLSLSSETIGIDGENYLVGKLRFDHHQDFPILISRSRFNQRRKRLGNLIARINHKISPFFNKGEVVYLVDSITLPIYQIAREKSCKIYKENFESAPDKGYSATSKSWYFEYKLHLVTSIRGVFSCMKLTKASVHGIHYVNDVKHSEITNCTLIADKVYNSELIQTELFNTKQIWLETPLRSNQHDKKPYLIIFKKSRQYIDPCFSQLYDQLRLKRNSAKTRTGLSIWIHCKISSITMLLYINFLNHKSLNHLKYALAS